ncbi:MAG: phosphohydrolase, partial [Pseudobutyrivibrio sp.]|nr:phosphohydrolase [Pseudobutyrivibrio sp.]
MDLSNQEGIICKAIEYVKTLFCGNSDGHDANHTLRVYKNVQLLLKSYPEADSFISLLSALLHDVDDHKLFKTQTNDNARNFLQENGLSEELIENICEIINSVS